MNKGTDGFVDVGIHVVDSLHGLRVITLQKPGPPIVSSSCISNEKEYLMRRNI